MGTNLLWLVQAGKSLLKTDYEEGVTTDAALKLAVKVCDFLVGADGGTARILITYFRFPSVPGTCEDDGFDGGHCRQA